MKLKFFTYLRHVRIITNKSKKFDILLLPYLNGDVIWKQLLLYNETKLLKIWINVRYNEVPENYDVAENLLQIFRTFSITKDMINCLNISETSSDTCRIILNELSKFGIFSEKDSCSFLNILSRLRESENIENIHRILTKKSSSISQDRFFNLLVEYFQKDNLFHVLNVCLKDHNISDLQETNNSIHLNLILSFRTLTSSFNEAILCDNILKVSKFLSKDLVNYFIENPIILLSLIFFTKDVNFLNILNEKSLVICDEQLYEPLYMLYNFNILRALYEKMSVVQNFDSISYYNLLERHMGIDVKRLYSFRFEHTPIPHFNSSDLVPVTEYPKNISYLFYVKQFRPSIACKLFVIDAFNNQNCISEEHIKVIKKKVYKYAVQNFTSVEAVSSSIAFIEMIGVNSEFLKVSIAAANILLDREDMDVIVQIFLNIEDDPYAILSHLENVVIDTIDFEKLSDATYLVEAVKSYDIVVRFSILNNLKLPEQFLKHCASNNLWLPFLIFAQIKNYPVEQIKATLQSLKNPNLLEHINHSVINDIQVNEHNVLLRERDSRDIFLSRIGVRRSIDSLNQNESQYSQSSYGSNNSSTGSDFLEIDILNTKATLLQTLIRCHNSTDPPRALLQACQLYRNPLLAILATSYEPDSVITNWLTWLAVSTELYHTFTNFESVALCAKSVTSLLNTCMKNQFSKILLQSFEIFIPNNPLKHFIDFLNICIHLNFDAGILNTKLEAFRSSLNRCRRYSILTENDHELTYLNNKIWIENTAMLLLSSAIEYNTNSLYIQIQFIQVLCDIKIESYFNFPNLQNLLCILKNIHNSENNIRFDVSLYFDGKSGRKAVVDCINKLLDCEMFEVALKIAQIEGLPLDLILIKEWQCKYQNWDCEDINFWQYSSDQFNLYNVTADCVIDFYLDYVDKVQSDFNKYQLLKLAYQWAKKFELSSKYDIEKRKWLVYVSMEEKCRQTDDTIFEGQLSNITYQEMLEMLKIVSTSDEEVTTEALALLEQVLNESLNNGNIWLALKLEKMFGCKSSDLDVIKLCFSLAEGILMPYQLNAEQRLLLTTGTRFRRRTVVYIKLAGLSPVSHSSTNISSMQTTDGNEDETPMQDTLALLHTLAEKLTYGSEMAYNIFRTYRVSVNIQIPYHVIVSNTDYMKMLRDALEDNCDEKLCVVHDFIRIFKWTNEQIADFICEEIVNTASKYVKSKQDNFQMWDIKMDQEFHLILQLLQENCSILGYKIYSYASAIHKVQVLANLDFKISELSLVIELLIAAHDCFTADCNMEGITIILKKCQSVISHLLTLRSWKLIVRLLIGVGRYTEMNYVFQILRENDQFEFLLRKGSRKDNRLKLALLEYLKKYCPDNRELYKIVALHFTLFSEVALLWERESQSIIKNLIEISKLEMQNNKLNPDMQPYVLFTNTDGTRRCLSKCLLPSVKISTPLSKSPYIIRFVQAAQDHCLLNNPAKSELIIFGPKKQRNIVKSQLDIMLEDKTLEKREKVKSLEAMENYTHATEFHLQGEKLAKAMNAAKQAELLALQMSLLKFLQSNGTTVCLLNLNHFQITSLIFSQLSFDQSLILVEAYNYQPDWASVLYEHCISQCNSSYLNDYLKHKGLTDGLVHDISRKFLGANINTPNEINCMKHILIKLPSIHTKYRIASELGFTDLVEELIAGGQLAYLKDTVWKKGYKS